MNEKERQTVGTEMLEKARRAVARMGEYKRVNRLCGGVRLFVGEDVLADLLAGGGLKSEPNGKYALDGVRVLVVKGYPKGYYAAE